MARRGDAPAQARHEPALCPSAQPGWDGARAIGVIGGTADEPHVVPLARALPASPALAELCGPVEPAEVFRFAAPCLEKGCAHFADATCRLARRIVALLPEVAGTAPPCLVRAECRWWRQEGPAACRRCPQVVTENYNPSDLMRLATDPRVYQQEADGHAV